MDSEYDSLIRNHTWELMTLPPKRKPISCKWIFRIKYKSNGTIDRYKVQLVARGFSQKEGIDYFETYSLVVQITSIRVLLAIATTMDWESIKWM